MDQQIQEAVGATMSITTMLAPMSSAMTVIASAMRYRPRHRHR